MEICATWLAFKFSAPFRSCLAVGFRLRRHDTSQFNQAVEVLRHMLREVRKQKLSAGLRLRRERGQQ